jgi:hypothetical protein
MKLRNYLNRIKQKTVITVREFSELLDGVVLKDEITASGTGTGATGPQGPQGEAGTNGTNGTNGEIGFSGLKYDSRRIGANQYTTGEIIEYFGSYFICLANNDALIPTGGSIGVYWNPYSLKGETGEGVPTGGTAGQIIAKIDATNYNTEWIDNFTSQVKHQVKAGVSLTIGQAVYVTSANGTNIIVGKSDNSTEATSSKTMGLIASNLANNAFGYVITEGLLAGLNTSAASAGDPVWLGTNGGLLYGLANKPVAPDHMVFIGIVTRVQSNNGEIFVKVQNGFELKELHDVLIQSIANNNLLMYESATNLWKNKTLAQIITAALGNGTSGQLLQTDGEGVFTWQNGGRINAAYFMDTTETSITGTVETINKTLLIPANRFSAQSAFKIIARIRKDNQGFNQTTTRIYIGPNPSSTSGATLISNVLFGAVSNFTTQILERSILILSATQTVFSFTANSSASDVIAGTQNIANINWTVNQYIIITTATNNATYSAFVRSIQIIPQ